LNEGHHISKLRRAPYAHDILPEKGERGSMKCHTPVPNTVCGQVKLEKTVGVLVTRRGVEVGINADTPPVSRLEKTVAFD